MSEIPKPISPRPWTQPSPTGPVYDAAGKVVSFIENAPYLVHVEQCHDALVSRLYWARTKLKEADIDGWHVDEIAAIDALLKRVGAIP